MKDITKKDLLKELEKYPDDAVICNDIEGEYFSIQQIKLKKATYMDYEGEDTKGEIIILK